MNTTLQLTSGMRVSTEFGPATIVEGMPDYPGYVYVSMLNPFSDQGSYAVLPMRREFVHSFGEQLQAATEAQMGMTAAEWNARIAKATA